MKRCFKYIRNLLAVVPSLASLHFSAPRFTCSLFQFIMIIDSKYTKMFVSDDLTRLKYNELYEHAVNIRDLKNKVSEFVSRNLLRYLDINKFQFITEMREAFKNQVGSSFDKHAYMAVIDCYQNKFDAIRKGLTFEKVTYSRCELYKRDTKNRKKGDFKKVVNEHKSTRLKINSQDS